MSDERSDRRCCVRVIAHLRASYRVFSAKSPVNAITQDVSTMGFGLLTESRMMPGTVLEIEIEFPMQERPIRLIGQVVWSKSLVMADHPALARAYETGGRFLDIRPEDQARLAQSLI